MKKSLLAILVVLGSASAHAETLTCFINQMTAPGIDNHFEEKNISPDLSNIENSVFGPSVSVNLDDVRSGKVKSIGKTFASDDFKGVVNLTIDFCVSINGDLTGYRANFAHDSSNQKRNYASVEVYFPISNSETSIVLHSGKKGLIETTLSCSTK